MKRNAIAKPLARLIKEKMERTQINKIRNEVTTDSTKIQRILRDYQKQPYANKMDNLEEMDNFLERYSLLPRLNQEEIENMHRSITSTENVILKNSQQKSRT